MKSGEVQSGIHQVKSALKSIGASYLFVIVVAIIILVLIIMCVSLLFKVFLVNPVIVGAKRFFSRSVVEKAELKELLFSFDHGYLNSVKAMFFKSLFTFLWTCLLLIPGAVKHYEYYMVPYLVGENPDMDWQEAFRRSKEMMRGQKWNAFVLDLSFAGWIILSGMTIGLVGIFYLTPYREVTKAGLFRKLSGVDEIVDEAYLN